MQETSGYFGDLEKRNSPNLQVLQINLKQVLGLASGLERLLKAQSEVPHKFPAEPIYRKLMWSITFAAELT